jgi:hypothetical protein
MSRGPGGRVVSSLMFGSNGGEHEGAGNSSGTCTSGRSRLYRSSSGPGDKSRLQPRHALSARPVAYGPAGSIDQPIGRPRLRQRIGGLHAQPRGYAPLLRKMPRSLRRAEPRRWDLVSSMADACRQSTGEERRRRASRRAYHRRPEANQETVSVVLRSCQERSFSK